MKCSKILVAASIALLFSGCRIVSTDEYKQLQSPESPYLKQAPEIFDTKLAPMIESKALSLADLVAKVQSIGDFNEACNQLGYRDGPDLQCNFPVKVTGTIQDINTKSRRGKVVFVTDDGEKFTVQIGPVIMGTALRDVMTEIKYKDFNDQTVYGEFGKRLNAHSVELSEKQEFKVGDKYEIYGAFSSWDVPSAIQLVPVKYVKQ